MEEVRDKLTPQERALLSDLWENKDLLRALNSAHLQRQLSLAMTAIAGDDWEQLLVHRGENLGLAWTIKFLKFNFNQGKKNAKATQEN